MAMNIEELNTQFGIPGVVRVEPGNGGLTKLSISTVLGAAEVYLHGAQVTSWRPAGAEEVIFVSERSHWEDGKAIRGGVPVCFPWFRGKSDDPKAPVHGFVRTREWELESVQAGNDGSVTVVCATEADPTTRRFWPHDFRLVHRITVGKTLQMELIVTNTGGSAFRFEEALHTYFRVSNVETIQVRGLGGAVYLDNMNGNREETQNGDLTLSGPTDNAYLHKEKTIDIADPALLRVLRTEKDNSGTSVVWNPWQQGASKLADLGDDEWHSMACVEAANILGAAVVLGPGEQHVMRSTLTAINA